MRVSTRLDRNRDRLIDRRPCRPNLPGQVEHPGPQRGGIVHPLPRPVAQDDEAVRRPHAQPILDDKEGHAAPASGRSIACGDGLRKRASSPAGCPTTPPRPPSGTGCCSHLSHACTHQPLARRRFRTRRGPTIIGTGTYANPSGDLWSYEAGSPRSCDNDESRVLEPTCFLEKPLGYERGIPAITLILTGIACVPSGGRISMPYSLQGFAWPRVGP